jgi:hypothetical protein
MTEPRPPKKSESLEIRIPYPTKQAFMERCREEGVSASEVLRGLIETRLQPAPRRRLKWAAAALIGLALGAVAAPSLALASKGLGGDAEARRTFQRLDADHDGALSYSEYRAGR